MSLSKELHEGFARFFEAPSRDTLRDLLKYGSGEADHFDFKEEWPDKPKIAKHILALANFGGGALIIGVKDSGDLVSSGLSEAQRIDKTDISKKVKAYLPPSLVFDIFDFEYSSDSEYSKIRSKFFQAVVVSSRPDDLPYLCIQAGEGIKANVVYTRSRKESTEADHHQVQAIFERRLSSRAGTVENTIFQADLDQLRMLYVEGQKFGPTASFFGSLVHLESMYGAKDDRFSVKNHRDFIAQLISMKKRKLTDSVE